MSLRIKSVSDGNGPLFRSGSLRTRHSSCRRPWSSAVGVGLVGESPASRHDRRSRGTQHRNGFSPTDRAAFHASSSCCTRCVQESKSFVESRRNAGRPEVRSGAHRVLRWSSQRPSPDGHAGDRGRERFDASRLPRALGVTPSAVSQQIGNWNARRVTLLRRSTRRLVLTDAGEAFYEGCRSTAAAAAFGA